ncbi:asparagine synthase C-terminal domain-containing protein [Sphingomonas sp. MG17]|uniref:asparagine synthase (glutamine-hydrolyzing) n=1 Tax=Sphingomonas tagetis TaxID=2949092 RepID=A0A9X2KLY6_9SPHN|nr:asparagine synthase C-terminal domain-containing protein [Sphingomonas tagetis]MCP3731320.1 asparagine synthase C-terminal domain-containing protein [Sphingomonas tagetis]
MALQFLAVVERSKGKRATIEIERMAELGFTAVPTAGRLALWVNEPTQVISTGSGRAHLLGRLFTRSDRPARVTALDATFEQHSELPTILSNRFWGQYLAISQCALDSVQVYRDPSGALPCYVRETPDAIFLFSDLDLGIAAGLVDPEIDWDAMVASLLRPALRRAETVLRDLYEIPQGWVLGIGGAQYAALRQHWSPWDYVQPTGLRGADLLEALRGTVIGTVRALAGEFDRIQLCLSGGLDSSIVAAALAGTDTTCLNLVSPGPEGDERGYARLVAEHLGLELVDRDYRLDDIVVGRSSAIHLPRPVGSPGRQALDQANRRLADEVSAQAVFSGNGGDNVFCFTQSAAPIVDCLRTSGQRSRTWRTVADICELTGCSVWEALSHALRKLPRSAVRHRWPADLRFIHPDLAGAASAEEAQHSWLEAPVGALPGRAAHIAALLRPQNFSEGFPRAEPLELITPMLAQPIVELCLSIQTWQWVEGGCDRAVARRAFAGLLPKAILDRRSKGGPGAFYRQIVSQFSNEIRERLLEGQLARQNLLDRKAVEAFFAAPIDAHGDAYVRLLVLADTEAWVQARIR